MRPLLDSVPIFERVQTAEQEAPQLCQVWQLRLRKLLPPQGIAEQGGRDKVSHLQSLLQQDAERGAHQFLPWTALGQNQSDRLA